MATASLLVFGVGAVTAASVAGASSVLIDFEDYPANGNGTVATASLTDFYVSEGVTFNGPNVIDFSQGTAIAGFAHSGSKAIESCYSAELCDTPIGASFADGQVHVEGWVGYDGQLATAESVILVAFDAVSGGKELGRDVALIGPSGTAVPVSTLLQVESIDGRVRRIEFRWLDSTRAPIGLAVDDIAFVPADPQLTVTPGQVAFDSAGVGESREISVTNSGNVTVTIGTVAISGADAGAYGILQDGCGDRTLDIGSSCTIEVELRLLSSRPSTALLQFTDSTGARQHRVELTGAAVAPTTTEPPTTAPTTASTTAPPSSAVSSTPPTTRPEVASSILPPPEASGGGSTTGNGPAAAALGVLTVGCVVAAVTYRRLRANSRRAPRPARIGRVTVVPGSGQPAIESDGPWLSVMVIFDPATGLIEWKEGTFP